MIIQDEETDYIETEIKKKKDQNICVEALTLDYLFKCMMHMKFDYLFHGIKNDPAL